jgi:hypothetical protein
VLAFITSLRHPHNSDDYGRVERLLEDSLASVLRQDCPHFTVWVVGNRRPANLPAEVEWVHVDFRPPSEVAGPLTGVEAVLLDKGTKLAIGLVASQAARPDHVMFFDSDDLVSRRLAALSNVSPDADGWRITRGWRWVSDRRSIRVQPDFHRHCGTGHIIHRRHYPVPAGLTTSSSQEEVVEALGERVSRHFGSHLHICDDLAADGHPLADVPFPGALYRVATGENHSGISMGGFGRPVSRRVADEFGIEPTGKTLKSVLRAVLPSRAAFEQRLPSVLRPFTRPSR